VIYVTDTPSDSLPFDARQLAIGEAIENVGFTGVSFSNEDETLVWRALVRNYGTTPATRTWHLESPTGRSEEKSITLEPGGLSSLQAAFPAGADKARVVLSTDRFTTDDVLPLVRPSAKPLALYAATSETFADLTKKMLRSIEAIQAVNDAATSDLALISYDPLDPALPQGNAIVFVHDDTQGGAYLKGGIVAEKHPLVDGLNWQSLLVRETISLERTQRDKVILWQEQRPLIFIREIPASDKQPAARQLCFNFDLKRSNAATQPGFIVMLHRFAESIRESKVAPSSGNLETNEPIKLATRSGSADKPAKPLETLSSDIGGKSLATAKLDLPLAIPLTAPLDPGFFTIKQGEETLLTASVHFGDTREADFNDCGSADNLDQGVGNAVERHTMEDPWWRIGVLALIGVLLISWKYTTATRKSEILNPKFETKSSSS